MSINRVIVSGNLTRDPETRQAGGNTVTQFGIAVNDRRKNAQSGEWEDVPNFFDVLVWGTRGESLARFISKGTKVVVAGRLRWSQWTNNEGEKRSKVEIVADDVDFMSQRTGGGAEFNQGSYDGPSSGAAAGAPVETFEGDIPF